MNNEFIEAGKIVNTHGIRGEVRIQPWADSPDFLAGFEELYISDKPVKIISAKVHKGCVIATLEGVDDIDAAIKMKNKIVKIKKDDVKLDEGTYFIVDLIGLTALDAETNEDLGKIIDVMPMPASNVYVIKGKREILIPAVPEFIVETNLEKGFIRFNIIEGLT